MAQDDGAPAGATNGADSRATAASSAAPEPDAPRRATFTPTPSADSGSDDYDDDTLATAMAAEVLKIQSGPIPIIAMAAERERSLASGQLPEPPQRRSLGDTDLISTLDSAALLPGGAPDVIGQLEAQMKLRADDAREYREWEYRMLSIGTPEALKLVDETKPGFKGVETQVDGFAPGTLSGLPPTPVEPTPEALASAPPPAFTPAPIRVPAAWASIVPSAADFPPVKPEPSAEVAEPVPAEMMIPRTVSAPEPVATPEAESVSATTEAESGIPSPDAEPVIPSPDAEPVIPSPEAEVAEPISRGAVSAELSTDEANAAAFYAELAAHAPLDPLVSFDALLSGEATSGALMPPVGAHAASVPLSTPQPVAPAAAAPIPAPVEVPSAAAIPERVDASVEPVTKSKAEPGFIYDIPVDPAAPVALAPTAGPATPASVAVVAPTPPPAPPFPPPAAQPLPPPAAEPLPRPAAQLSEPTAPQYDVEPDDDVDDTDRAMFDADGVFSFPTAVQQEPQSVLSTGTAATIDAAVSPLPSPRVSTGELRISDAASAPKAFAIELAGAEPTELDQRVGRSARLFWLWFAANSSILSLAFGGAMFSLGISLRQAIVGALVGVALSFLPLGLGTLAGKWSGQPTMIVSRATFGLVGNILPSLIAVVSRLFWGAVLLWMLAAATAHILVRSGSAGAFGELQLTLIAMAIGFLIALIIAFFGYGLFARIQLGITVLSVILVTGFVALTFRSIDFSTALTVRDGPWILVVTSVVLVFSFVGLVWANSSSDLARYQRPSSSGGASMIWAPLGTTVPTFVLIAYGAILAASNPAVARGLSRDPIAAIAAMLPSWYPVPLIVFVGLGLLSGAILSIYSGGFALQAAGIQAQRSWTTVIAGVLVFALAMLLTLTVGSVAMVFRDLATSLAVPVAAWAGIFAAEMILRRRRFDSPSLLRRGGIYPDVNWLNLVMLVVAIAAGFGLTTATVGWLRWEGYLFTAFGVPLTSDLAGTDVGVLVALALGLLTPLVAGLRTIRRQEAALVEA